VFVQVKRVLLRHQVVQCAVQDQGGRADARQRRPANVTAVVPDHRVMRVYTRVPRDGQVPLAIPVEARQSSPVLNSSGPFVATEVLGSDVSFAAPHHELLHPVDGFGRDDQRDGAAVAPAQHRVPVPVQRLRTVLRSGLPTVSLIDRTSSRCRVCHLRPTSFRA